MSLRIFSKLGKKLAYRIRSVALSIHALFQHFFSSIYSKGHDNRPVAIVAGGFNNGLIYTVEIWDFTKQGAKWTQGKTLFM